MPHDMNDEESLKFKLLIDNDEIAIERHSDGCFLISHCKRQWAIWDHPLRWTESEKIGSNDDMYYGTIATFYKKNILGVKDIPLNHGKTWSNEELSLLHKLILSKASTTEIADIFKRKPGAILLKTSESLGVELNKYVFSKQDWHQPIIELIHKDDASSDGSKTDKPEELN
jgi:hypothetical protein